MKHRRIDTILEVRVLHRGLTVYRAADPGWRWGWNRYPATDYRPARTIGAAVVLHRLCIGLTWRRA